MTRKEDNFLTFDQFILRTPLWSLNTINDILEEGSYEASKKALIAFFSIPVNQEALYISSPSLYNLLKDYLTGNNTLNEKKDKALVKSLYKYATRMATRPTPFGLFAGCSLGSISNETKVILDAENVEPVLQLDSGFFYELANQLLNNNTAKEFVKFYPNATIYPHFNKLRYIEDKEIKSVKEFTLTSVDDSGYVRRILKKSNEGATIAELTNEIVDEEVTEQEARGFILEMIDGKLLINELAPSMLNSNISDSLRKFLSAVPDELQLYLGKKEITVGKLKYLLNKIDTFYKDNAGSPAQRIAEYHNISAYFDQELLAETNNTNIYKVDFLQKYKQLNLQSDDFQNLSSFISAITHVNVRNSALNEFKRKFSERFDQQEIPLLKLLDNEIGLNYPLRQSNSGDVNETNDTLRASIEGNNVTKLLLNKYIESVKNNRFTVEISDDDIKQIAETNRNPLQIPATLCCLATLLKEDENGAGQNIILKSISQEAARLIGRFAHLDEEIGNLTSNITGQEQARFNDDYILAEIDHTPSTIRYSNVVLRNNFYKYQIRLMNCGTSNLENQIALSDLHVSLRNNMFVIRSKKHNKIIIPKNSTALNPLAENLALYRFVEDVGKQYCGSVHNFQWPEFLISNKFLPRLVYKNITLIPASWIFKKDDIAHLLNTYEVDGNITNWLTEWNIPRHVVFCEGDNELYIDFNNSLSIDVLLGTVKDRSDFYIREFVEKVSNSLISDSQGNKYCGQFVIPFKNPHLPKVDIHQSLDVNAKSKIKRHYYPGDEWVYFKIYCNPTSSNKILINAILPLCNRLKKNGCIDQWFFIRFSDPDYHLRLRFRVTDLSKLEIANSQFSRAMKYHVLREDVFKIQSDTYSRELERYGQNSIEIAETFFHYDSVLSINVIKQFHKKTDEDTSLMYFAIQSIDTLLNDLKYSVKEKSVLLYDLSESFGNEFGKKNDKNLKKYLAERFKQYRKDAENILLGKWTIESYGEALQKSLRDRSILTKGGFEKLIYLKNNSLLATDYNGIIQSYIHMIVNRLYPINQRRQEMFIYDLLYNVYNSNLERTKKQSYTINETVSSL